MAKGILATKLGMSQIYKDDQIIPVTIVEAGPCVVTQIKTTDRDGYAAIQIGYGEVAKKKVNKPLQGHFDKAKVEGRRHLAEVRLDGDEAAQQYEVGQEINVTAFEEGQVVKVTGTSKGKGFAGPMKRWNFRGLGASHGAHGIHRAPGSIGSSATPSRVLPGKRMAGQYGNAQVTVKNLEIVRIDAERNILALKGAIPGPSGGLVMIQAKN